MTLPSPGALDTQSNDCNVRVCVYVCMCVCVCVNQVQGSGDAALAGSLDSQSNCNVCVCVYVCMCEHVSKRKVNRLKLVCVHLCVCLRMYDGRTAKLQSQKIRTRAFMYVCGNV